MTSEVTESNRLPGGLSRWRAWRVLARDGGVATVFGVLPLLLLAGLMATAGLVDRDPVGMVILTAPLVVAGLAVLLHRPGAAVTEQRQPAVHTLVAEAARRIGTAPPDRIWLTGEPVVVARVKDRRRDLRIGLPLVACLPRAELAALIGHELSLLHHRRAWLVTRLWRRWYAATEMAALHHGDDEPPPRWARSVRTALDGFAAEVSHHADGAAVTAAGSPEVAARAFARAATAAGEYDDFLTETGIPPRRWWRLVETAISDLDDGWRRLIGRGIAETDWDADEAATLAELHPRLAGPLRTLGATPLPLGEPTEPVTVTPLDVREQRRIVRRLLGMPVPRGVRWRTFRDAPAVWWLRRARRDAESVREDVEAVLGRPPADDLETIQVVQTRTREVVAVAFGVPVGELSEDVGQDDGPQPAVIHLVEYALLRKGWRLAHPAVRGVLVGPHGESVDAARLIANAFAGTADLTELRKLLNG